MNRYYKQTPENIVYISQRLIKISPGLPYISSKTLFLIGTAQSC